MRPEGSTSACPTTAARSDVRFLTAPRTRTTGIERAGIGHRDETTPALLRVVLESKDRLTTSEGMSLVARKSPIGKIKDAALGTAKLPFNVAGKAVGGAVGGARTTVGIGKALVDEAAKLAGQKSSAPDAPAAEPGERNLRPVPTPAPVPAERQAPVQEP